MAPTALLGMVEEEDEPVVDVLELEETEEEEEVEVEVEVEEEDEKLKDVVEDELGIVEELEGEEVNTNSCTSRELSCCTGRASRPKIWAN